MNGCIIRKLSGYESVGSIDYLLLESTGILTYGDFSVKCIWNQDFIEIDFDQLK